MGLLFFPVMTCRGGARLTVYAVVSRLFGTNVSINEDISNIIYSEKKAIFEMSISACRHTDMCGNNNLKITKVTYWNDCCNCGVVVYMLCRL